MRTYKVIFGFLVLAFISLNDVSLIQAQQENFTCEHKPFSIPVQECEALQQLYSFTDGQNWLNQERWFSKSLPCYWYGIACENGHVTELRLNNNRLRGKIPPAIADLTELRYLNLAHNQLSGSIPSNLGQLSKLEYFNLAHNRLSGRIPSTGSQTSALKHLDLSNNQISGTIPSALGQLSELEYLKLSNMRLGGSIPPTLGNLVNLQKLFLDRNNLSGSIPSQLGNLLNLTKLYLFTNRLSGSIPDSLGNLPHLRELSLSYNRLTGPIPQSFATSPYLIRLNLAHNQLEGRIPFALDLPPYLQYLNLSHNQFEGRIPLMLTKTSSYLTHLDLSYNQLTGSPPATLGRFHKLTYLDLSNNPLRGRLSMRLSDLKNLSVFVFDETEICEPVDDDFQMWLHQIYAKLDQSGLRCSTPLSSTAPTLPPMIRSYTDSLDLTRVPDTRDKLAEWLTQAWRIGAAPEDIVIKLTETGWLNETDLEIGKDSIHQWITVDLDSDGVEEWLLTISNNWFSYNDSGSSDLWIINGQTIQTQMYVPWGAPHIINHTDDITGDGLPEIIVEVSSMGAHTQTGWYYIFSAHHGAVENIVNIGNRLERAAASIRSVDGFSDPSAIRISNPEHKVTDLTGDGLPDFIVGHGGYNSVGAGPWRSRWEIWTWDGNRISLANINWGNSKLRIHALYEANLAFSLGNVHQAIEHYEQVINSDRLQDGDGLNDDYFLQGSYDSARQFAAFRLALSHLREGNSKMAEQWRDWLRLEYPAAPLTNGVNVLFDEWQMTGDLWGSCAVVTELLYTYDQPTAILENTGYGNPSLTAETVCSLQ